MPKALLTAKFVETAKARAGEAQTDVFDTTTKGLVLRVSAKGSRTFYFVYSRPDGTRARLKLGAFPTMVLGIARERAREARAIVAERRDPAPRKGSQTSLEPVNGHAGPATVSDLIENWVRREGAKTRSGPHRARRLRKNFSPFIGKIDLGRFHKRDVTRCLDTVMDRGAPSEAFHCFADMRALVRWAHARGDLDRNIMDGMKSPSKLGVRDRWLSTDEIAIFWNRLPQTAMAEARRQILRLCLVTGQRVSEVAGMAIAELDLETATWNLPAERVKNGRSHVVPLSTLAVAIIKEEVERPVGRYAREGFTRNIGPKGTPFVFPRPEGTWAISGGSIAHAMIDARKSFGIAPFVAHDLRRTAASHMAAMGISPLIISHILNHALDTKSSITTRVYAHYDYAREKREALDSWANRLAAIIGDPSAKSARRIA